MKKKLFLPEGFSLILPFLLSLVVVLGFVGFSDKKMLAVPPTRWKSIRRRSIIPQPCPLAGSFMP